MTFDNGDCTANSAADATTDTTARITGTADTRDTADTTETRTTPGARTSRGKRRRRALTAAAGGALLVALVPACQSASGPASGQSTSGQSTSAGQPASADGEASAGQAAHSPYGHDGHPYGHPRSRGDLISAERVGKLGTPEVKAALKKAKFDPAEVKFGVRAYRLRYRTVDAQGHRASASGLLVLPRNGRKRLRTVSYAHGTTSYRPDVASEWKDAYNYAPGLMYSSAGFATVLPDYLGLGKGGGKDRHPYLHVPSETSASLDMLRAARQFTESRRRTLDGDVFVTGFSQGASAAMGLARALERHRDPRFSLRALAPISGVYDFRGAELPAVLRRDLDEKSSVAYVSYMLDAWDRLHDIYPSAQKVFRKPYADRVGELFDGSTPGPEMMRRLPGTLDELLTPYGKGMLRHPRGRFAAALKQADSVCSWRPKAPVRLHVARKDEQAATANTAHCAADLRKHQAPVRTVDLGAPRHGGSRHLGSNVSGTAAALRWFLKE